MILYLFFTEFRQKWKKDNVQWLHDGEAVQYEPKKWYFFRRDLSIGPQTDRFTLPNVPMIVSTLRKITDTFSRGSVIHTMP